MNISEKMFPGSIVALLLGVLLAAPLFYSNVVIEPVAADSESLLSVELTYAYIEQINGNYIPNGSFLPDSQNPNETMKPGIPVVNYFVACNLTRLFEDYDPCDAKLLVYVMKFYSDNEFVGNLGLYEGIIYNSDLVTLPGSEKETGKGMIYNSSLLWSVFKNDEFFGNQPIVGGGSYGTWNMGESRGNAISGVNNEWGSTFGEPETMHLTISLLGWISLKNTFTNTVILGEAEVVAKVQMEKFGDGFLYNTVIPEDKLSELDPLNPIGELFGLMGDLN